MSLSPDFGKQYIESGGATFPKEREDRERVVETFVQAQEILLKLGYHPDEDISALIGAYQGLSERIRNGLENGDIIGKFKPGELKATRKYFAKKSLFFGNSDIFAIDKFAEGLLHPEESDIVIDVREKSNWGMPPSLIMIYARSLASADFTGYEEFA